LNTLAFALQLRKITENLSQGRIVAGLCGVFIPGWVGAGKWQSQYDVVCPCGAVRSPAVSGGGRMYISACADGITVVCWMAVSSL